MELIDKCDENKLFGIYVMYYQFEFNKFEYLCHKHILI